MYSSYKMTVMIIVLLFINFSCAENLTDASSLEEESLANVSTLIEENLANVPTVLEEGSLLNELKSFGEKDLSIAIIEKEISKIPDWGPRVYDLIVRLLDVLTGPGYPLELEDLADKEYDYIVVGAGSAGSTVATRLSEVKENRILVLEAGGEESAFSLTPIAANFLLKSDHVYQYRNQREKWSGYGIKDNRCSLPVGRGISGGSGHNNYFFSRGNPADYNRWEQLGATGWSWQDVFPYYYKLEKVTKKGYSDFEPGYHGTDGLLAVQGNLRPTIIGSTMLDSAKYLNFPLGDFNGANQTRFSFTQQTLYKGQRGSVGRRYLAPVSKRKNLDIVIHALVLRVLIDDNKRAYGVEYEKNGEIYTVKAKKEVILSASTYNNPRILMLSGVGPKDELKKFGIPVIKDLPGVGQNLHDHPSTFLYYTAKPGISTVYIRTDEIVADAEDYANYRNGTFASGGNQVRGFIRTKNALDERPDVHISYFGSYGGSVYSTILYSYLFNFKTELTERFFTPQAYKDAFFVVVGVYRPLSRGYVALRSKNIRDEPIIHTKFYSNDHDLKTIVEGIKVADKIAQSKLARERIDVRPFPNMLPGCDKYKQGSDDFFRCYAQTITIPFYHPVGTCKMGRKDDLMAVVDSELRVMGIKDLRVVDISIMPEITTGNTNAPAVMIGEKAADMIRGRKLKPMVPPVKDPKTALKYDKYD